MKKTFILLSILLYNLSINGQVRLNSGSLELLKSPGQKLFKVEFSYDNMKVKGMTEADFIKKYTEVKNTQKPGLGDDWAQKWQINKNGTWEPQFESYLNASIPEKNILVKRITDSAKYIMTVCPTELDPGFFAGISQYPGFLYATIYIKDIKQPEKFIAVLSIKKARIKNGFYVSNNEFLRVMDSFGAAGEKLGKYLSNKSN
jgi:hypothetical protein